jgi:hypothetical protein
MLASRSKFIAPIVLILLLAAATRIINAGHYPVWTDEGWSTWPIRNNRLEEILETVAQDRHPPLYFLSLSAWETVAGNSRIALRFLSIAGGILSVAVVYRIGADWFSRTAALYAAGLFAVLNPAVYYAQEIRHYSWLVLSVCLMSLFFLRYLRHPRPKLLIAYVLSIVFMLYTLYFGVFVLAVQIVIGLFVWRGKPHPPAHLSRSQPSPSYGEGELSPKIQLVAAWVVAGVLYIPWLLVLWDQVTRALGASGIQDFPGSYETTLDSLLRLADLLFGGQAALLLGIYLLGCWYIVTRRSLAQVYLVLWGGGVFVVMFVANLWFGLLSARTLVFLTPALMLVCGVGFSVLAPSVRRVLGLSAVAFMLLTPTIIQPRLNSDAAAQALAADFSPGDLVILETGWDDHAFYYEVSLALPDAEMIRTLRWVRARPTRPVVPEVEDDIRDHQRVWVVNWLQPSQVISYLDDGAQGFQRVLTREVPVSAQYLTLFDDPTIELVLFERPDTSESPRVFGDVLALHDALVTSEGRRGQPLHVDLWWSALNPPPLDYSVGVFLLDENGTTRAEHNAPPGSLPTTQWTVDTLMFDRHTLISPADLPDGSYTVIVNVYWYGDQQPLTVSGMDYAEIGQVVVGE